MAIRLFIALTILVAIMWFLTWYRKASHKKRKKSLVTLLLYALAIALIALVVTGRIPWLFAVISAVIPWLNRLHLTKKIWFFFHKKQTTAASQKPHNMSIEEAFNILNLGKNATRQDILDAHRKLIQKNHPDRGGSDYLAQRINLAKEILIKHIR